MTRPAAPATTRATPDVSGTADGSVAKNPSGQSHIAAHPGHSGASDGPDHPGCGAQAGGSGAAPATGSRNPPIRKPGPGCREIFLSFSLIGAMGFGGVMPWMRWLLVNKKAWYSETDFNDAFAVANAIPGGNVVAIATMAGGQLQGWRGAVAALSGLTTVPAILVCAAGQLYLDYRHLAAVQSVVAAVAGAGLNLGIALRMMRPLLRPWQAALVSLFTRCNPLVPMGMAFLGGAFALL